MPNDHTEFCVMIGKEPIAFFLQEVRGGTSFFFFFFHLVSPNHSIRGLWVLTL